MAIFVAPILAVLFIGWVLYHALLAKDLKKYKTEAFYGFAFIGVWAIIYLVFINIA
ncbi:hypothetical protein [Mucilaginibacter segetis]|uniref:Uncharacterized protein n=1 Tax=Mucilaginibacter segetis TaxID=2793071 RepID=A0A934UN99_9SPHI|nr:hypothetical protein [Mucilaginibacter segetis]MBK0380573.1 hypothetical protein [Mucilaginibacter segetis]